MKKIVSIAMLLWLSVAIHAQTDATKFLGIPVDGSKSEMIQKLMEKGYTRSLYDQDVLEGDFNGAKVHIFIGTNNNKVCRIMVCDVNKLNETDIKIRFNNLCRQFQNNRKYVMPSPSPYTLDDEEDISYGMTVKNKRYQAAYYQITEFAEELSREEVQTLFWQNFSKGFSNIKEVVDTLSHELLNHELNTEERDEKMKTLKEIYITACTFCKSVWFMINEFNGKYYITMYYDNKYNQANGEDL